jgi:broad specificity phosphatase PhoE
MEDLMSRLTLGLVRHGESEVNSGIWSANPAQTQLTPIGIDQAKKAAAQVINPPDLFLVSPLIRAKETLNFFINRWPDTLVSTLPIEEFIYRSPSRLALLDAEERKEEVNAYWLRADPYYCDGHDAESFAAFIKRVADFYQYIIQQKGYVITVGHGQFFKAFQLGLTHGFSVSSEWMYLFREQERLDAMKNGELVTLYFE